MPTFTATVNDDFTLVQFDIPGGVLDVAKLPQIFAPVVDPTKGVIISGRGPIWLFAFLCHHFHPTAWVATHDPRLGGGVVVQSHSPKFSVGQVVPVDLPTR